MKVLVAEDNLFYRRMLESMLSGWGYEIVPAKDGAAAWEALRQPDAPPLAILNWMMPGLDGLEVCRKLRQLNKSTPTYVILLTAKRGKDNVAAAMDSGADDYLVKPFLPEELRMRLQVGTKSVAAQKGEAPSVAAAAAVAAAPAKPVDPGVTVSGTRNAMASLTGYEILGELGRGGMGVVFRARHIRMDRVVAIKVIHQDHLNNPDAVKRFYQEVQAAARLNHPNIVIAYDAGELGNTHYLSMEYVDGLSLGKMVKQTGPLDPQQACAYIRQAALGLQHAHEKGMVHRDINPANLLVAKGAGPGGTDVVKILDMGLALLHHPSGPQGSFSELTREGRWIGTVDYMSPEQWTRAHKMDTRGDIYSLGCTFYYLLTGAVPFPCDGVGEKMLKHHMEEPIPLEKARPDAPPAVAGIIRRMMAKQPADRYQTPAALAEALAALG